MALLNIDVVSWNKATIVSWDFLVDSNCFIKNKSVRGSCFNTNIKPSILHMCKLSSCESFALHRIHARTYKWYTEQVENIEKDQRNNHIMLLKRSKNVMSIPVTKKGLKIGDFCWELIKRILLKFKEKFRVWNNKKNRF